MENLTINQYEAPVVEIIEVEVEKGFAASTSTGGQLPEWEIN